MKESNNDNNNDNIDYNLKIKNFMAMTETGDPEVAQQYLSSVNWDETKAVNKFYNKIKINTNANNLNINNSLYTQNNSTNNNNNNNNQSEGGGFFSNFFSSITNFLFSPCISRREIDIEEENKIFKDLPNKINNFEHFNKLIKRNIGIIIFYSVDNIGFLKGFINKINGNSKLKELLNQNVITYPLLSSTDEAYKIENMITDDNLKYPSFFFCYNNSNNILNKNNILNRLDGENIELNIFYNKFYDKLLESLGKINKNIITNQSLDDNKYNILSDGEILEKQKHDMEVLEKQEELKEEEIKKEKINEEKIKEEIEKKANEAKNKILDEPDVNNPDCTVICFRYPDGEQRKDRRFLKNNTIQNLYDYVTSLGREIYTEEENNSFSLYQPFPPKKYDNMENTLEKEGLFPNAIIQIKEEE